MALNPKTAAAVRNASLDGLTTAIGSSGFIDIYDGTQATDADTALGAQVKLAHLALSSTAAASASAGSMTFNTITSDSSADATGTATWYRITTSAGVSKMDGSVGTSGANLNLNSVSIVSGAAVAISSFTVTMAA